METQDKLNTKLKTLIKEQFKTQKEFACSIGIDETQIGRWFKGKSTPTVSTLDKIANHCNIHISYFFSDDENASTLDEDLFNEVFKLAYQLAIENEISINGSYFLACYDLIAEELRDNPDKTPLELFEKKQKFILKHLS